MVQQLQVAWILTGWEHALNELDQRRRAYAAAGPNKRRPNHNLNRHLHQPNRVGTNRSSLPTLRPHHQSNRRNGANHNLHANRELTSYESPQSLSANSTIYPRTEMISLNNLEPTAFQPDLVNVPWKPIDPKPEPLERRPFSG